MTPLEGVDNHKNFDRILKRGKKMFATNYKTVTNNLDKIFAAMRNGKYHCVIDPKGNAHVGIINAIMREDGSGKNWIVTVTARTVSEKVFIHAS